MDDFDEKIAEMAEAYTLKRFEQTGNAGFTVAPYVNSDELSSAFEMGAQAARELLRDEIDLLQDIRKAQGLMITEKLKENEALRHELNEIKQIIGGNEYGDCVELTKNNRALRDALGFYASELNYAANNMAIAFDLGKRARECLSAIDKEMK